MPRFSKDQTLKDGLVEGWYGQGKLLAEHADQRLHGAPDARGGCRSHPYNSLGNITASFPTQRLECEHANVKNDVAVTVMVFCTASVS